MRRMLEKIMACYGSLITLSRDGETRTFRAFLQPSGEESATGRGTAVGQVPLGTFLYIGTEPVREGDTLRMGDEDFLVRQAALFQGRDGPLYCRGLCVRKGEADSWGS